MGHDITAVIGSRHVIQKIVSAAGCPEPTELTTELVIAPLGHQQIDRLTKLKPGQYFDGFKHLSTGLEEALARAAGSGPFAYIETSYAGGSGGQTASLYRDGNVIFRQAIPISRDRHQPDHPINSALRALGVKASKGRDEFDTVGLRPFRSLAALGIDEDYDD